MTYGYRKQEFLLWSAFGFPVTLATLSCVVFLMLGIFWPEWVSQWNRELTKHYRAYRELSLMLLWEPNTWRRLHLHRFWGTGGIQLTEREAWPQRRACCVGMPLSELQTWCAMWKVITPLIPEAPAKPSGTLSGTGCISPYRRWDTESRAKIHTQGLGVSILLHCSTLRAKGENRPEAKVSTAVAHILPPEPDLQLQRLLMENSSLAWCHGISWSWHLGGGRRIMSLRSASVTE